jgi:hypothetical protein
LATYFPATSSLSTSWTLSNWSGWMSFFSMISVTNISQVLSLTYIIRLNTHGLYTILQYANNSYQSYHSPKSTSTSTPQGVRWIVQGEICSRSPKQLHSFLSKSFRIHRSSHKWSCKEYGESIPF